jgi:error-prone DNA polymerase
LQAKLLMVEGKLQREGEVTHVIVKKCHDLTKLLKQLSEIESPPVQTLARADEKDGSQFSTQDRRTQVRTVLQGEIFPSGRNFR